MRSAFGVPDAHLVVPLSSEHDRASFSCGESSLDDYLKKQAGQDVRRLANAVFVLTSESAPERVIGFYTLAATTLSRADAPEGARKWLPRYPLVSATLLGRLAVASTHQGQGLGGVLLADALQRAAASARTVGSCMVVVDAISDEAAAFYQAHGFVQLPDTRRLVLPMTTIPIDCT